MPDLAFLRDVLILFGLSVAVVLVVHRARVPPIVGFLITGVLCGPYGFGLIRNVREVEGLAEIGVILLLFTVGIEFSVQRLLRLRSFILLGGGLQVALTLGATAIAARALGERWPVAVFLGMLVALSSTAIVLRLLSERGEVDAPHGQAALGILIFQDLCVVPMMLLTPFLSGRVGGGAAVAGVALKVVLFIAAAVVAARYLFPWVLNQVVSTRKRDVFLLTVILLGLGTAWASARVGLSLALGAFIAGLVLSESQYSHQALGEILPLREVFNSLFFVSMGMLFDVRTLFAEPLTVLGVFGAVILLKGVVAAGVGLLLGLSLRIALVSGFAIAQIGEFSFVLSKVGLDAGLLDARLDQVFLAAAVGTMAATPAVVAAAPRLAALLEPRAPRQWATGRGLPSVGAGGPGAPMRDHVIIVGYGLNGRNLARVLGRSGIPFAVVEINPDAVRAERRRGRPIIYGDATRPEILQYAGVERARVLVIAISDAAATRCAVALARRLNPALHVIVRSRYVYEMEPLVALGTDEVVPEEYETSIEIFSRVLQRYLVPRDVIERMTREVRSAGYETFRSHSDVHAPAGRLERYVSGLSIDVFRAEAGSEAAGKRLSEAAIRERCGATVVAIQRAGGEAVVNPSGADAIDAGDSVLLLGRPEQLTGAAALFRAATGAPGAVISGAAPPAHPASAT